jgi:glycosyltransferase involved in cell wall biosynthesis
VVGRVETQSSGQQQFRHIFYLYCAPLSYRVPLLHVDHDIGLYPAEVFVAGDAGPPIRAVNPDGFADALKEIFSREKTKTMIASLLAQSK